MFILIQIILNGYVNCVYGFFVKNLNMGMNNIFVEIGLKNKVQKSLACPAECGEEVGRRDACDTKLHF